MTFEVYKSNVLLLTVTIVGIRKICLNNTVHYLIYPPHREGKKWKSRQKFEKVKQSYQKTKERKPHDTTYHKKKSKLILNSFPDNIIKIK